MSNFLFRDRFQVAEGHQTMGAMVSVNTPGVTLIEDAPRFWRRVSVGLNNVVVPITAAQDYGSVAVLDLSDGLWWINGSHANFSITRDGTGIVAATNVIWSMGKAAAFSAPLTGTMADIRAVETFSVDVLTDSVDTAKVGGNFTAAFAAVSNSVYLNFNATLTVDGSVTVNGNLDLFMYSFERP